MKTCMACKNFYFDEGSPGYSELTPGWPMEMSCTKKHFHDMRDGTSLEEMMRSLGTANSCDDYELSELAKKVGWT